MLQRFIGIGAQKCASSWMHDILADHPQVDVASTKEVDFFSHRYELGLRWYEGQFVPHDASTVRGEISPSYFHEPSATERALAYDPSLKILASLRDPVERALSQHRHLARLGLLPADDLRFETALATNPTYVEQGLYHRHLARWIQAFGRDRVHVVLMDDIERDRVAVARDLYRFLGIDADHRSAALDLRSNPSYVLRSGGLDHSIRWLRNSLSAMGAGALWRSIGDMGLRNAYRRVNRRDSGAVLPPPDAACLGALRRRFHDDTQRLAGLIDRDLTTWMAP